MPWLFFGAIVLVLLLLLTNWAAKADRATVRRVVRYFGAFLVAALAVFLFARGQAGLALALIAAAGALASRRRLAMLGGGRKAAQQKSEVDTPYLRVTLDHDSGEMTGTVLAGRFAGQRLDELSRDELSTLYDELSREDSEGARLLDAYLARAYPGDWQEETPAEPADSGPMTRDEAFEVLGLAPGATSADIKEAHHRLMKKFHPDQGGSTYFAARLNEAKDLLLKT
ncbi:MAG: DnaJ domain-containing protein [Sphingomonadales bacterium]